MHSNPSGVVMSVTGILRQLWPTRWLSWMNGKRSRDENHESKGASKGKDCHEPPTTIRTKAFVFLPQSDVFAEGPPPPRELSVVRELCVGFGKHLPKRHVSAKSRQHKSAQKQNGQKVLWHAIILRIPITVENRRVC